MTARHQRVCRQGLTEWQPAKKPSSQPASLPFRKTANEHPSGYMNGIVMSANPALQDWLVHVLERPAGLSQAITLIQRTIDDAPQSMNAKNLSDEEPNAASHPGSSALHSRGRKVSFRHGYDGRKSRR